MMEQALWNIRNWIYQHYYQICILMLRMQIACMAEEAFFMACWIQAFNELPLAQLRLNIQLTAMLMLLKEF